MPVKGEYFRKSTRGGEIQKFKQKHGVGPMQQLLRNGRAGQVQVQGRGAADGHGPLVAPPPRAQAGLPGAGKGCFPYRHQRDGGNWCWELGSAHSA